MNRSSGILTIGSWALVALSIGAGLLLSSALPSLQAVVALLCIYWLGCWLVTLLDGPLRSRLALFRSTASRRPGEIAVTWVPAIAVGVIAFLPAASALSPTIVVAAAVVAVINAITEETLWRGAFIMRFPDNFRLGVLLPLVPFASWHLALALIPIDYGPGGPVALVGGAGVLGLLWGWVVWRTRNLRSVVLAHAVTNFFGFAAVGASNWPSP